jgi:inner membrane protein YhjD
MAAKEEKQKNIVEKVVAFFDAFQRRHRWIAIPHATVKKFGDDGGGYLAALMTYYGFLSLFPLLIVATGAAQIIAQGNTELKDKIISGATSYFPAIGESLAASLHTPSRSGIAVFVGLVVAFYGTRGIAGAVQHALHVIWAVPRKKRAGFPFSLIRGLGMVLVAGIGLIVSAILSGYATASSLPSPLRFTLGFVGFIVLFGVFWTVFTYGSSAPNRARANIPGALIAAFGLQLLQAVGGYLITNQLGRYSGLNAQFAVVLVLLFWIYLQAQVFLFSLEFNTVRAFHLYPRALDEHDPTEADMKAHELYAARDSYKPADAERA